ncbi:DUF3145 family protein [Actinotignum schaalii]
MAHKYATRGVIFIHSVMPAVQPHVEWAVTSVLGYEPHFEWTKQPAAPHMNRAEASWTGEVGTGAMLASALNGWEHLRFEITEDASPVSEGAGPGPHDGHPAGTVWIAVSTRSGAHLARELHIAGGRSDVRSGAVRGAVELLGTFLHDGATDQCANSAVSGLTPVRSQ